MSHIRFLVLFGLVLALLGLGPGANAAPSGVATTPTTVLLDSEDDEDGLTPRPAGIPEAVWDYAPRLRFHPNEGRWPMSSLTFISHSNLYWKHDGVCSNDTLDSTVSPSSLDADYSHRTKDATCDHVGRVWSSDEIVRVFHADGPENGDEGMALNLENGYRDGDGFNGQEPV